jgi:ferric iron reductase protein FhuF
MLDNYFYEKVKERMPELLELEVLKAVTKLSKSKLISYIYQHQETEMMNFVRAQLRLIGKPAVASIHDAVIVKQELVNGQLADLNLALRKEFGNELLLFRQKGITGYKRYSIEPEPDFPMPSVEELLKRLGYSNINESKFLGEATCTE